VVALVKQIPMGEALSLGPDGRLQRTGIALEMNAYCRRAVSFGCTLAQISHGSCTVMTLGPPSAQDVLREAIAWGADDGVHLCDPAFAGSDTLATARALAAALEREGPFDLVLVGRNTLDGDTGQVGPEVAELLGLPFACGARSVALDGDELHLGLQHDDGWEEAEVALPALLSVAERLCDPCKKDEESRRAVPAERIRTLAASDLGQGSWGDAGSPTKVGAVRVLSQDRARHMIVGDGASQVDEAVSLLEERGALLEGSWPAERLGELTEEASRALSSGLAVDIGRDHAERPPLLAVAVEPARDRATGELLGAARRLAAEVGGRVVAVRAVPATAPADPRTTGTGEAADELVDEVVELAGAADDAGGVVAEDMAAGLSAWARDAEPWVILLPSTSFGREVAGRCAASLGAGLVGDAVGLEVVDGVLVAAKPAFSGALVADISCTSPIQMVSVRPGALPPAPQAHEPPQTRTGEPPVPTSRYEVHRRSRTRVLSRRRDDDVEVLARAEVVIGVGTGVAPGEYDQLAQLAAVTGAELAATRKVTDNGWAPRSRQIGITGRSIAPRLYIAIGVAGKFNHVVGVRGAGTVVAINSDPSAPVFEHADIGIVGDWHNVVPHLAAALRALRPAGAAVAPAG